MAFLDFCYAGGALHAVVNALVGNLLGLGLGPYSADAPKDYALKGPARVDVALMIVAIAAGFPSALLFYLASPAYAVLRARMGER